MSDETTNDPPKWENYRGAMRAEWRGLVLKVSGPRAPTPWWAVYGNESEIDSGYPATAEQAMRDAQDAAERYLRERGMHGELTAFTIEDPRETTITVPAGVRFTVTFHGDDSSDARSASDNSDDDMQPLAPGEDQLVLNTPSAKKWERWTRLEGRIYFESMVSGGPWIGEDMPHTETVERAAAYLRQQRREARAKGGA